MATQIVAAVFGRTSWSCGPLCDVRTCHRHPLNKTCRREAVSITSLAEPTLRAFLGTLFEMRGIEQTRLAILTYSDIKLLPVYC